MDENFVIHDIKGFTDDFIAIPGNRKLELKHLAPDLQHPIMYLLGKLRLNELNEVQEFFLTGSKSSDITGFTVIIQSPVGKDQLLDINFIPVRDNYNSKEKVSSASSKKLVGDYFSKINQDVELLEQSGDRINNLKKGILSVKNRILFRENQFRKINTDLQILLENNNQASLLIDNLFTVVKFNSFALEKIKYIFGIELQKNIVFTSLLQKKDVLKFKTLFNEVLKGKEEHKNSTFQFKCSNEDQRNYAIDFYAARRHNEQLRAVTIVITDITNELFDQRVKELNFELMQEAMKPSITAKDIANLFTKRFQAVYSGTFASILLNVSGYFKNLSSPSLPDKFIELVDGLPITAHTGTCGKAIHQKSYSTTHDLNEDENWKEFGSLIDVSKLKSCTSYPILNSENKAIATFGVYRKIQFSPDNSEIETCQGFAEILSVVFEMLEQKNKQETLVNSIQDGFLSLDSNFYVKYWNKSAENISGIKSKDAIDHQLWSLFPKVDAYFKKRFTTILLKNQSESMTAYFPFIGKWIEFIVYPSQDQMNSIFFRDVSEREERDKKIIETNERLEKVMNATSDAIYEFDLIEDTIHWSNGYRAIFGHEPKDDFTSFQEWKNLIHKNDRTKVIDELNSVIKKSGSEVWNAEYSYQRNDNTFALVIDKGYVIRDNDGKPLKIIGAVTDISYRKAYEQSLLKLNTTLRERAVELNKNNEELEQFAYLASHDLQEPLRMITNFISQLEKKYGGKLDEKAHTYMEFIVDGANRMRRLITDLLKYSHVGKTPLITESVSIEDLLKTIKRTLQLSIQEADAVINHSNLPTITSSESQLYHIFSNLISNAIKYRKKDQRPIIEIKYRAESDHHIFTIEDNGIGITNDFKDKIFEIFKRLHHNDDYSGTGIGLAIVKKSVEQLNGSIDLYSNKNGTTFILTLPKDIA
jgi:PAS domain S-box-containing protein